MIGYATTYDFYQTSIKFRSRISQFLVLPPYQNKGIGKKILNAIYGSYIGRNDCIEITVEDPSDDFMCMRNLYDARLLMNEGYFEEFKQHEIITSSNIQKYKLSKEKREQIHMKLKLTHNRIDMCYELIKYAHLDKTDSEAIRKFRLDVKKRLYLVSSNELNQRGDQIRKKTKAFPYIFIDGINVIRRNHINT